MTMDTSLVNKEALQGPYSVKQPVAPKRSFDVAFLTGNHKDSDESATHLTSSNNNKKASRSYCCTDSTGATVVNHPGDNGSAFTKVAPKREFSPRTSPVTNLHDNPTDDDPASLLTSTPHPFLLPPHLATSLSLQFFQSHSAAASKGLAMSLFGPAASQLLQTRPYSALFMAAASAGGCQLRGSHDSYFPSGAKLLRSEPPAPAGSMAYSTPPLNASPLDPRLGNLRGGTGGPGPMGLFPGTTLPNPQVLPSSLAALSAGTAQNMCAKCNLSFRMTSDLVYHMRSQHRQDTTNKEKQRRQEKLRCPVCGESFRERHHLTRHMTSHEDREAKGK
nr:EOG090X0POW [Triops cancriformis]